MAVIQKTLFAKNLDRYSVLVNDTDPNSKYFKVTELPDTLTGGKNAFLVAGSKELVPDTKIQIELKDAAGNIIYHEPGEGYISSSLNGTPFVTEYYEGVSKVVSVYIYPDTSYGPCTLTILGELSEYTDVNGIVTPVGLDWENKYNVKWTKTINVNPNLANTTKIRFYQRPTATITEILSPIYSIVGDNKVASAVTQSFANIKLSKLETFAGDVKRVKVFRTSEGDISDYDLIQDILIESKELLTSYGLSGSVVGETGILTSETLKKYWNTGSLNTYLTSSRVESGVRLTGRGNFRYTSSLDIKTANTYELNLDAFYSSSTSSNLGIYLSQVTTSGDGITPTTISSSIATLVGTQPTKNLLDTVIPFKLDRNYPSASLYFSQSQGEWHLGNISLKLSQDTAFSPDEVSFVTTMPTVLGNETYNFKFEFYDVNNNYVPVAVTQSALFTGGNNNINGTLTLISSSASGSAADLLKVSSSISGTMTVYSSSASSSVGTLSGSVSGTIGIVSSSVSSSLSSSIGYTSGSIYTLSGSVSSSQAALSASISRSVYNSLTASFTRVQNLADGNYSGSFISGNIIYAPVIGGQLGYFSTLFKVGQSPNSIYLDARQTPRKIFIGGAVPSGETEYSGAFNSANTSVYLDSGGQFSLKDKLTFTGNTLTVNGTINASAGTFSGNITSTATITGGTISGGTISGGTIAIGSGNSIFKASTDGISLGNATFADAPFRVTAAGALTATSATISGALTATSLTLSAGVTVPNASVDGLGSLALKNNVSALTDVTNLGSLATRNTVNATYIDNLSITTGLIAANTIVAGNIASLKFTGKDARFDTGSIAGWDINTANINKIGSTHTMTLDSANNAWKITENANSILRVTITGSTSIPAISVPSQDSLTFSYSNYSPNRYTATANSLQPYANGYNDTYLTSTSGRSDGPTSTGYNNLTYAGIIGLIYPTEEIWIDDSDMDWTKFFSTRTRSIGGNGSASQRYQLYLRVRKYANHNDAYNETNLIETYTKLIASNYFFEDNANSQYDTDTYNLNGTSIQVNSNGSNYFRVDLRQIHDGTATYNGFSSVGIYGWDFNGSIVVRFGAVNNGYSLFGPGGLQVYQGFKNYMNVSTAGGAFFQVKGKSTFESGLYVSGTFDAQSKQFKITHPLNENKWLYHTSTEAPRADLIYRGTLQLENGGGSASIDSASNMTIGTFDALTKNPQLFLQNNESFDKVKGYVQSGSVYVLSENQNSKASIDWSVIAERKDNDLLSGKTYINGKYQPERYKIGEHPMLNSGSI